MTHRVVQRVVVAPHKFTGSMSADRAAHAIAQGIHGERPELELVEFPVADGGEGTVSLLVAKGFEPVTVLASGPLGDPVTATIAMKGGTAVIESASVAGLAQLGAGGPDACTALQASTYGVGELIKAVIDHGATRIIVGLGGSASTDGGAGAVTALGGGVLGPEGLPVRHGGGGLTAASRLELADLDVRLEHVEFIIACDVDNPLTGPSGAAFAYGPQEGATSEQIRGLEAGLRQWANVVSASVGSVLTRLRLRSALSPSGCARCTSKPAASSASTAQYQP